MPKNLKNEMPVFFLLLITVLLMGNNNIRSQDNGELRFNYERGFYNNSIAVTIVTEVPDANIHYTLNGSEPGGVVGQSTHLYNQPITIDKTSCLRAVASINNEFKTEVVTHTYIFINDVPKQDYQVTLDAGFPQKWGEVLPDYGMDPDVVNDSRYTSLLDDALLAIPSISVVLNIDDMFGQNGIYTHSNEYGIEWERPASVELIYPDGTEGFQVDCGIRIQGGWFRQHHATKKHSFRLLFKSIYGSTKLRYPLFGKEAVESFDTIVLRAGANDGYSWSDAALTEQYIRDEFGRSLQSATGNAASHSIFAHLYINGIYWGLYNPVERPDQSFCAQYYGGEKENWDAINSGSPNNGDLNAWNQLLSKSRADLGSNETYQAIQGNNPDGSSNAELPNLVDIPNYIDYMIVNMWGGNWDWPWKNYWICRDRTDASTGFKFFCWDYENTMGNNRERSPLNKNKITGDNNTGVGELHSYLRNYPDYNMLFADHIQRYFFNEGIFTSESLISRYRKLALIVELSIIAESARWGDQHHSPPLTQQEWFDERDWILNTYLPARSDIVLNQFKSTRLYPAIDVPVFEVNGSTQHGGQIEATDEISITANSNKIYYTLNGSDPRLASSVSSGMMLITESSLKAFMSRQQL
jgi:spore coat protein CotH